LAACYLFGKFPDRIAPDFIQKNSPMSLNLHRPLPFQPVDSLDVIRRRHPLVRFRGQLAVGEVTVGFAGGSITADNGSNWPNALMSWLAGQFPAVRFRVENAAVGATGSDSACLRADRELIRRSCDLTFVEFAVNDFHTAAATRQRSREGLLRKLLAAGQDVVLVYTYRQEFYAEMMAGQVPESISEFEALAAYYGISSVWVGLAGLREVCGGKMKWEEWLPDGLHPGFRGSDIYARNVAEFFQNELAAAHAASKVSRADLPVALFARNWQHASLLPFSEVQTQGPWLLKRVFSGLHLDQVLETHSPGARLSFAFEGWGLALVFQYGKRSAEFAWRIDGQDWQVVGRPRFDWGGDSGMVQPIVLAEDLRNGLHLFEIKVVHGNRTDCTGTECRLAYIGVLS
jgi:lysophospholipase L1-like esterase